MARKKKPLPILENILITDYAAEGKAIAKVNDIAVFVPFAAPGDIVNLQVTRKRSSFMEARVINFIKKSDVRTEPFCEHFGVCGGCKWQHLPYSEQIRYKQKEVENNLRRIGKVKLPDITPIIGSEKTFFYRNKLEFTFSNRRWRTYEELNSDVKFDTMNAVGFHIPGMFDKVLDIKKCWLQDDIQNQIRNEIRAYALQNNLTFFDLRAQEGFLRTMMVRTTSTGELMLIMVFFYEDKTEREKLLQHLVDKFPQITSLLYVINSKANDTITDQEVFTFKGAEAIFEKMEELRFKIGPKSFYQTNSEQAYELYKIAKKYAELTGDELVYDLYTGTGTIANFVSKNARKVIGIEYVPEAIEDAKENSKLNGIENTLFVAGDMKNVLTADFIAEHGKPDVIITDPPRAGMHDDVIKAILLAEPNRIVYVSCNSATQARDLSLLDEKYEVTAVQPVDMFPHTHHVENVVQLKRKAF
ncbi:MAG: 23S rRNA (uracil(1939)-C(5))-methyltransferase RlmD [Porphyromonadaceae bacterium]|jgi:23S rRNA (uracil1939-C5)-methyltransferase|nr:23S rRNA (uracil(1939)-C(5))-methyltransferase RlmD [Porphyromonadaceae bacterium]